MTKTSNIFMQRKRDRAKKTNLPIVKSYAEQQADNAPLMREFAQKEAARKQARLDKMSKKAFEERARAKELDIKQCAIVASVVAASEHPAGPSPRKLSSARSTRPPAERAPPPKWTEFVDPPTWGQLLVEGVNCAPPDYEKLKTYVRTSLSTGVLCAPVADGRVFTWDELAPPPSGADDNWRAWCKPSKWLDLVALMYPGNPGHLASLSLSGNYNNIVVPTPRTPTTDVTKWPPQLSSAQLQPVFKHPNADHVVRMTREDPFPHGESSPLEAKPIYRSLTMSEIVDELTYMLYAASVGIGPPVYAATFWPWQHKGDAVEPQYGMIAVLQRADGDVGKYQRDLHTRHPPVSSIDGPTPPLRQASEECAVSIMKLCFKIAASSNVNFDIKPANMLWVSEGDKNAYFAIDFDGDYFVVVPDNVACLKARFFVNMLLFSVHVRAYSRVYFAKSFLAVVTPVLMDLWLEATSSSPEKWVGSQWLMQAKIASQPATGAYNHGVLRRIPDPARRLGRQLEMMTFSYLFDNSHGRRPPLPWPLWEREPPGRFFDDRPSLVRQLLRFAFFYESSPPAKYQACLQRA